MTESLRRLFFSLVFALVFYVTGATFVQGFVNYPTWKLIGAAEFQKYHNAMSPLIIKFMVMPWFAEILLTFALLWLRPRTVPLWPVTMALVLNLIVLVSTVTIQIPIQMELGEHGFSLAAIERLLATDPVRWTCGIIRAGLYLWMMSLVLRRDEAA